MTNKRLKFVLFVIVGLTVALVLIGIVYWRVQKDTGTKTSDIGEEKEKIKEAGKEKSQERALSFSGLLFPGEFKEITFPVDGNDLNVSVTLTGEENPFFELTDPGGNKITLMVITIKEFEEQFSVPGETQKREDCVRVNEPGWNMIGCMISAPAKGWWKAKVGSGLKPKVGIIEEYLDWSLNVYQRSDISFEFDTVGETHSVNAPVVFRGTLLKGGVPLGGASVRVNIGLSAATVERVLELFDDGKHNDLEAGDGIYGNEWTDPDAGYLLAEAEAMGEVSLGIPYMRQGTAWFTVVPRSAHFSDEYSDIAIDEDGDGLFDKLIIKVGVILDQGGEYGVHGTIIEADGTKIQWGWTADLVSGKKREKIVAELDFPKEAFVGRKVDGPVVLSELWLMDKSVDLKTDSRENAYTTKNYKSLDFSGWEARISGPIKDSGVDINGNGKFDYLEVQIPVEVRRPGTYTIQSLLLKVPDEQRSSTRALEEEAAFTFSPGINTLTLKFSGPQIAMYATNGPYLVNNFQLVGPLDDLVLMKYELGSTAPYSHSSFEQDTAPPTSRMNDPYEVKNEIFHVNWSATDPSPSVGPPIVYDVQYRVGKDGAWKDWLREAVVNGYPFGPNDPVTLKPGQTYYFRVRARDFAGNQEPYRDDADTHVRVID